MSWFTSDMPWLTMVLLLPAATAVLVALIPRGASRLVKAVTVAGALATALIVAGVVIGVARDASGGDSRVTLPSGATATGPLHLHYEQVHSWMPSIGASYHLGIDGVSVWLLALNAGVFLLGALVVSRRETERLKFYCGLLLFTETATAGVLLSIDLLLFYLFWEAMLIPLYFLLGSYGPEQRSRATLKFVGYTVAGSLAMLLSIIYLYTRSASAHGTAGDPLLQPHGTFDLQALLSSLGGQHVFPGPSGGAVLSLGSVSVSAAQIAFLGFALAFAIKVPMFPFHTWLPDSYEACPPAALTFFAGIVSKLGAFGFVRYVLTLFPGPSHDFQVVFLVLSVTAILYGAIMALSETDIKRIVAYSSVSHLGFVTLGIWSLNANGLNGAIIQMVNHGIIIAALFLVVGMIEQRTGTRDRRELAGLEQRMPWLYFFFLVITLAGLGMPGMNSFVGEFTIMLGAFQVNPIWAVLAGTGVVLACWYMLRLHQGLMHERLQAVTERVRDLRPGEALVLVPLVALMILIGVFPRPVGDVSTPSAQQYVAPYVSATTSGAAPLGALPAGTTPGAPALVALPAGTTPGAPALVALPARIAPGAASLDAASGGCAVTSTACAGTRP